MPAQATNQSRTVGLRAPALDRPHLTWRGVGIAAVLWVIYTVLYSLIIAQGAQIPFAWAFQSQMLFHGFMAALSVPVWVLIFQVLHRQGWLWKGLAHLLIAPLYAWVTYAAFVATVQLFAGEAATREIQENGVWIVFGNFTTYVMQFAVYHTVQVAQRYRRKQQQAAELQALTRQQELRVLKAQINPHFLFNTLNAISAMVARDPDETREMISRLSDLLRYALDSSERDLVPLREEVAFVKAYLELETHRFSDRLQVEYEIDEQALDTRVPPMVLQPLVENAIKHGIAPSETGGCVLLRIHQQEHTVAVQVEDTGYNGQVASTAPSNGIGLANTSARLERTFGPAATLQTEGVAPHGFRVRFVVPRDRET